MRTIIRAALATLFYMRRHDQGVCLTSQHIALSRLDEDTMMAPRRNSQSNIVFNMSIFHRIHAASL